MSTLGKQSDLLNNTHLQLLIKLTHKILLVKDVTPLIYRSN
jgi:hypothetical protein